MKRLLLGISILFVAQAALAEAAFQFAWPGLRAPDDPDVGVMRFTMFHGQNRSTRGVDFGFFSQSETERLTGFQAVAGIGKVSGSSRGLATAIINVHTGTDIGVNAAFINRLNTLKSGLNISFVNVSDGYSMADLGGVNVSDRSHVQLGFLNVTKKIETFQFGFLNVAENGFLPVFPVFNFPKN